MTARRDRHPLPERLLDRRAVKAAAAWPRPLWKAQPEAPNWTSTPACVTHRWRASTSGAALLAQTGA
jgi:hypothetical protein